MAGSFARKLRLQCCHLGLQLEHPANTGEGEPFLDEDADLHDSIDLLAAVASLPALRPGRADPVVCYAPPRGY
jgi:hypothetical protein